MRQDGQQLGPPAHLPGMRPDSLLRQLPKSPRNQARGSDWASGYRVGGAGRALAVLLSGCSCRRVLTTLQLALPVPASPKASAMPPSFADIWTALAWGAVSSVGLLVGAIAGSFSRLPHQKIAMAMSVGAGLLLAAVSLKLTADAVRIAGPLPTIGSLLLGAAVFSGVNAVLARFGATHRKRCGECTP